MQCRSAIGTGWGLEPQKTLWIYEAILKPKLTDTALIRWKTTKNKTIKKALDRVQAVMLRGIYGLRRSAPTAAIRMLLDIKELDIRETAARSAYRLWCSNEWVENRNGNYRNCNAEGIYFQSTSR